MTLQVYCRGCGKESSHWEKPESALRTPYCSKDCKRRVQNDTKNVRFKDRCRLCGRKLGDAQRKFMAQKRLQLRGEAPAQQVLQ